MREHKTMNTSPLYAFLEAVFSSQRPDFQCKENSHMQRHFLLAFGIFSQYESSQPRWELLLMPHCHRMLQVEGTSRQPFHFSNRETGLEGAITCAKRSEIKDFKITFGLLSCFYNSCQVTWQREKDMFLN